MQPKITNVQELKRLAHEIRRQALISLAESQSGHTGGSLGLADIFAVMAHQTVAFAGYAVLDLTGCGDLEAFLHTTFGLQLGHFGLL